MNILVTGVAGFIGSNLSEYLLKKKHIVIGLDNFNDYYNPKVKEFNIESFKNHKNFILERIDIVNNNSLKKVFEEHTIDAVVHLAAWAGVTPSVKNPDIYVETNVRGTNNLAKLSTEYNVKSFVYANSSSVYGNNKVPFVESMDRTKPNAPYPATKMGGEILLWTYHVNFDLYVTSLIFFNPLGPKLRPDMALPKMVRAAKYGYKFPLYQNIMDSARDYTHILPMLEVIEKACLEPKEFEVINLGSANPIKLIDLLKTVEKVTKKKIQTTEEPLPGQMKITYANVDLAKKIFNYNPRFGIEKTVKEYYDWFMKQPEWYKKGKF